MPVKCTNCGGAHPKWDCSKPVKSTAARKDVRPPALAGRDKNPVMRKLIEAEPLIAKKAKPVAGTQALPVDTLPKPKIGRPRTGFNKKEYNRQFTADLRTIKRLGLDCTVKEWRSEELARSAMLALRKSKDETR